MDPFIKDCVQVAAWSVAIIGGLLAAFKAIHETAENRRQRQLELRWKKAELARRIIETHFSNKRFRDALTMLDYTGREFEILPGRHEEVKWEDLSEALRPWQEPISFDEKQVYIRDCFDALFDGLNLLEHYLKTDLLDLEDIRFPMAYYVGKLREHREAIAPFMNHYGNHLARDFIGRFDDSTGSKPQSQTSGQPIAKTLGTSRKATPIE